MKAKVKLGLLSLVISLFIGCDRTKNEVRIEGQVFITQRNGQSVTLGGVELAAVKLETARERARTILKSFESFDVGKWAESTARRQEVYSKKAAAWSELSKLKLDAISAMHAYQSKELELKFSRKGPRTGADARREHAALKELYDKWQEVESTAKAKELEHEDLQGELTSLRVEAGSTANTTTFPGVLKTVTWNSDVVASTDADGRFIIDLPASEKFCLVAFARRELINGAEDYGWVVVIEPGKKVLLNHLNLADEETLRMVTRTF